MKAENMKRQIVAVGLILVGAGILLAPKLIRLFESRQTQTVQESTQGITKPVTDKDTEAIDRYNKYHRQEDYNAVPKALGKISIPSISLDCPLSKGTEEQILQNGIGVWETEDIPSDKNGTSSVLIGHNGIYGKDLFTDLNKVKIGDKVFLTVCRKVLCYTVVSIEVVLPEAAKFEADKDESRITLFTCTPYGQNTHRLLVRAVLDK